MKDCQKKDPLTELVFPVRSNAAGDTENSSRQQIRRAKSYKNTTYYTLGLSQQHKNNHNIMKSERKKQH